MAASNHRIKDYQTAHHIMSRIAHSVYFLEEDERNDLIEITRRASVYCGIKLLAWCIMTNHFHLLIYVPEPCDLSEDEILSRYGALKGSAMMRQMKMQIAVWRGRGESGEREISKWCETQKHRMNKVSEFMKIVKQWFTEEYNRRHSHRGTLWEAAYQDKPVQVSVAEMSRRMGYIHLNPIRAAAVATFEGYAWSSFAAIARGDEMAEGGLRFVYDDYQSSIGKLKARHRRLLDELLEWEKRKRAEAIARKRTAGYKMPEDPLTTEAMIIQAAAQLEKARKALAEVSSKEAEGRFGGQKGRGVVSEKAVLAQLKIHPEFSAGAIADALGMSVQTVYRHIKELKRRGVVRRSGRGELWEVTI